MPIQPQPKAETVQLNVKIRKSTKDALDTLAASIDSDLGYTVDQILATWLAQEARRTVKPAKSAAAKAGK